MRKYFILFCLVICFSALTAQKPYFQQDVKYEIEVTLDDKKHQLRGLIDITYTNNSPETLEFIYFHLWPNAYKDNSTALGVQMRENGSLTSYFADDKSRGFLTELDFEVDEKKAVWSLDTENPDIALVRLAKPLQPGGTALISTPFMLQIPASVSRLGHVGQSYQFTQWYPKPAVYDRDGWHAMPYLDQGEFYSEFGSYRVKMTMPKNYVVGATGELQTESEKRFLAERVELTKQVHADKYYEPGDTFPASSTRTKTIEFTANDVHDFAWFADKRYHVEKGSVSLASGKEVDTWVMYTDAQMDRWHRVALKEVNESVKFYSEKVGEYPWPHCSAVQSIKSAGGGMEYPMITLIGYEGSDESLASVLNHEVGHNWFYGILGSNERDHAWMDEGFTYFFEKKYIDQRYNGKKDEFDGNWIEKLHRNESLDTDYHYYKRRACNHTAQAPSETSENFERWNYYMSAYDKPALALVHLENYLGTPLFNQCVQKYFQNWKFKHPKPSDVEAVFESTSGKNLDWFFQGFIGSTDVVDYKITNANGTTIDLSNEGTVAAPVAISRLQDGKVLETQWFDGFAGSKSVTLSNGDYDEVRIDAEHKMLEVNRENNFAGSGLFKNKAPLKLKLLGKDENDGNHLFYSPIVGWNNYDKGMVGLAFTNTHKVAKKFEFFVMPLFGLFSQELVGTGNLHYSLTPKSNLFDRVRLGLMAKSYSSDYNFRWGYHLKYSRVTPSVTLFFKNKNARSKVEQRLQVRSHVIWEEAPQFGLIDTATGFGFLGKETTDRVVNEVSFMHVNNRALHPYGGQLTLQHSADNGRDAYVKAHLRAAYKYTYNAKRSSVLAGLYVGAFLSNADDRFGNYPLSPAETGYTDYTYDGTYLGRTDQQGWWASQIQMQNGHFKIPLPRYSVAPGRSNALTAVLNIEADAPFKFGGVVTPKVFLDAGTYSATAPTDDNPESLYYAFGIGADVLDGAFGFYFPFAASEDVNLKMKSRENPHFCLSGGGSSGTNTNCINDRIHFYINLGKLLKRFNLPSSEVIAEGF